MRFFQISACLLFSFPLLSQAALADWEYGTEGAGEAMVTFASISGEDEDGSAVTLRFSERDLGGRQLRLHDLAVLPDCDGGCRVEVSIDGGDAETVRATLPQSSQPTLSLRDAREIWRSLADAEELEIIYPDENGASRSLHFAVGGMDPEALSGWN